MVRWTKSFLFHFFPNVWHIWWLLYFKVQPVEGATNFFGWLCLQKYPIPPLNLKSWWIILMVRATYIRQQQTTLYHAVNYSLINPNNYLLTYVCTYLIYFMYVNWGMVLIIGRNFSNWDQIIYRYISNHNEY